EQNWAKKPLFQLRSMAQTRACAKAMRNVLAWVVVLAGYAPTPAEEMTGEEHGSYVQAPKRKSEARPAEALHSLVITHSPEELNGVFDAESELNRLSDAKPAPKLSATGETITEKQQKRLFAIAKQNNRTNDEIRRIVSSYGYEHTSDIPKSRRDEIGVY